MDFQPMSPEEMQRTVQFLLRQQASFEVRIETLAEQTTKVADGLIGLTAIVGRVVDQMAEAQTRTDEQIRATNERWQQLSERMEAQNKATESHIDIIIQMFERHLREDHGHRPS